MKIIYFDICAIPLFLMILFICYWRKMTKGNANQLFIGAVFISLFSAIADLGMEIPDNLVPLSEAGRLVCSISTYLYLILRNATNAVLLLFLLALTQTAFLIRKKWAKAAFCLPYGCILVMLAQNPFTHNAFTVTAEAGYARGPLMMAFYGIALLYGLVGLAYCIFCRRYLPVNKWGALLSIYILGHLAVVIQFFHPEIMVEMFCTALGEMLIMFSIMRPEERMDSEVGALSWTAYQSDLRNILLSGERVKILVLQMPNCLEIRRFLGDHRYNQYLSELADGIRTARWDDPRRMELYFERPGAIYLIADGEETGMEDLNRRILPQNMERLREYEEMGVRFEPRVCLIRCPEDLRSAEDIISLGHNFPKLDGGGHALARADEMVHSRTFAVEAHIEEILDRAIREHRIQMHYQPIYHVPGGRFHSAEALARLNDPEYGIIPPSVFIPAAETLGFIIPIGDAVLEQVFRFIAEHDLEALGLSYIEVNLSVAQCMESRLPEKIRALQEKYGVDPARINLEITESTFAIVSQVMLDNIRRLSDMGYTFALDDYGTGYSNIQRVNRLPLKIVKIDKSMLDEAATANGRILLEHTMRMMQSIGKLMVAEGAETAESVALLEAMHCDYIQGYYFSRPLPGEDFLRFVEEANRPRPS